MPQRLLRVRIDKLMFHETRESYVRNKQASTYWLGAIRGFTPSLEIHRIWNLQYHERLLSEGREADTKKV